MFVIIDLAQLIMLGLFVFFLGIWLVLFTIRKINDAIKSIMRKKRQHKQ